MNFWEDKIKAFLHDPPDKALKISGHENRRDDLLKTLNLKFDIPPEFDRIASSMERIVPKTDIWIDFSRSNRSLHPVLRHPITGSTKNYENLSQAVLGVTKTRTKEVLNRVLQSEIEALKRLKSDDSKVTYFRIWRFFKDLIADLIAEDLIAELRDEVANLPADTRCPDHTVWDHLNSSSAIYGAISKGEPALLMFKISPVQDFIKNARKERDLWAGSHLLSFLTFQAIKVVVDEFGPDAVIFPHLREQPFFDKEFEDFFKDVPNFNTKLKDKLKIANIPNKFLAIVGGDIGNVKEKIRNEINKTLEEILDFSLKIFGNKINDRMRKRYLEILQNYFNVTICSIPADFDKLVKVVDQLPNCVKEKYTKWLSLLKMSGYERRTFDLYSLMFELLEETTALESRKFEKLEGLEKEKCTLCGELEIIGSKDWWKNVDKGLFKENERLCPVCLVKRFYSKWMEEKWGIETGFESVSNVALKKKIENEKLKRKDVTFYDVFKDFSKAKDAGCEREVKEFFESISEMLDRLNLPFNDYELVYKENLVSVESISKTLGVNKEELENIPNVEKYVENARNAISKIERLVGEFPRYYAILMMDGDNMGKMLIGDEMKSVENYLHPSLLNYLPQDVKTMVRDTKRLIIPATHSAISKALAHFSINIVPKIVDNHGGELIYAGGDDVLALLPTDSALACAYEIQRWFGMEWNDWNVLPAKTISAGILIVHYKHPLYDAIDKVRRLERKAKDLGRDAVTLGYLSRSGSYDEVTFNWCIVPKLGDFIKLLKNSRGGLKPSLSRRMIYHVVREVENLPNDENAIKSFLKYEFSRHYSGDDVKRVAGVLTNETIDMAKNVRIKLDREELENVDLVKVNSSVNDLIKTRELSAGRLYDKLRDVLGVENCKFYEKLYCAILKRQVKGLFILLKILLNCDFGGVSCEGSD